MTKNEFIAMLKIMGFKENKSEHRFVNKENRVILYSDSAVTTIDTISNFHTSYTAAIERLSTLSG